MCWNIFLACAYQLQAIWLYLAAIQRALYNIRLPLVVIYIPLIQLIFNENLSYWRQNFINFRFLHQHNIHNATPTHIICIQMQCRCAWRDVRELRAICRWWAYCDHCTVYCEGEPISCCVNFISCVCVSSIYWLVRVAFIKYPIFFGFRCFVFCLRSWIK